MTIAFYYDNELVYSGTMDSVPRVGERVRFPREDKYGETSGRYIITSYTVCDVEYTLGTMANALGPSGGTRSSARVELARKETDTSNTLL